jgi:multicomponent Na+:H+ antiporter subunit G
MVTDVLVAALMIGGALMSLAAGIGLVRFPDLLSRMHAATKPQVLGLLLFLLALAVENGTWLLVPVLVLCWVFQLLTSPVSAHMVGRAGYRTRHLRRDLLTLDELDDVVARAAAGDAGAPHPAPGRGAGSGPAPTGPIVVDPAPTGPTVVDPAPRGAAGDTGRTVRRKGT